MNGSLYRSRDRVLAGVAGGLADYFDVDPSIVRVAWVLLAFASGGILVAIYIVMAIVVPDEPEPRYAFRSSTQAPEPAGDAGALAEGAAPSGAGGAFDWRAARDAERQARREARRAARREGGERYRDAGRRGLVLGIILIVVGGLLLVREYVPAIDFDRVWPLALVVVGVLLIGAAMRRDR